MTKKYKRDPIPKHVSRRELAKFWDSHSIADYMDELKPVKVKFAKNLSEGLTIRLDPKTLKRVRNEAFEKGVGPTTLIRMWIREQLKNSHPKST